MTMKKYRSTCLILFAAAVMLPIAVSAQQFEITHYVIASGGGSGSTGSSGGRTFVVDGTIGQNLAGTTSAGIGGGGYSIIQDGFWAADFLAPTAAPVSISGRVLSSNGQPLHLARVILTAGDGSMRSATTNTFGFYSIDGLGAGQTYILTAMAKGFAFAPRVVTLNEDLTGIDLTAANGSDQRTGRR
jgi:hypothetical protein